MGTYLPWLVMVAGVVALFGLFGGRLFNPVGTLEGEGWKPKASTRSLRDYMPAVISILVLASALWVILHGSTYGDSEQKWAAGAVGTILGYWFKK
jgi:hypothetical protein